MNDTYFFIRESNNKQFINKICTYIRKKGKFIENYEGYEIYYIS